MKIKIMTLDNETEGKVKELIRIHYQDTREFLSVPDMLRHIVNTVHGIIIDNIDKVTHDE